MECQTTLSPFYQDIKNAQVCKAVDLADISRQGIDFSKAKRKYDAI